MKKSMVPFLFPLAIACLAPALALASPARHGRTPQRSATAHESKDPIHVQVARAMFPREYWQSFVKEASAALTHQIAETGKGQIVLDPGFADRLQEQYEELMPYEEMLGYQARLLDSQYTKAELRRLLAFYRTPLGRKSLLFNHDLVDSSRQRAQLQFQNSMATALAPLRPLVRRVPRDSTPDDGAGAGPGDPPQSDGATGSSATEDDKAL
jgi:uncharacterized protein